MTEAINTTQLRLALAEALGESPDSIQGINPKWVRLMKEGVLVQLHIGRWRGKTRLTWSDLGIDLDEEEDESLQSIIDLGHKKLLPAELLKELDGIDSAARKWLAKKAFRTHWGYFVPVSIYADWKARHEEYRADYFAARDRLLQNYGQIIGEVINGYRLHANRAYNRLMAVSPEALAHFKDQKCFVDAFIESVRRNIWQPMEIESSFRFDVELNYIPLPSLMAQDTAEKERIELAAAAERERVEMKLQDERDAARAKEDIRRAEVEAARDAAEWKRQLMMEMHQDVINQARAGLEEQALGFVRDVAVQLRSLAYKASLDILAAIQRGGTLPPRSVVQFRNLAKQVKELNIYGDSDLEAMINRLDFEIDKEAKDRDIAEIEANLKDAATIIRSSLIGLGEEPRRARGLGISDDPPPAVVRRARRRLGLDEPGGNDGGLVMQLPAFRQARLLDLDLEVA